MLSSIMGHDQVITDEEIALCRQLALEKRESLEKLALGSLKGPTEYIENKLSEEHQ